MNLLEGKLVRLKAAHPEGSAEQVAGWWDNSEFARLLDAAVARPLSPKTLREEGEEALKPTRFPFSIWTLADDKLIGFGGLGVDHWHQGDGWLGIGIGEPAYWGKGFGTDAVRAIARFGFEELNLRRISLGVFAYNERAVRAYEKAGFVVEGRVRQSVFRDGQRWDEFIMGLLREDWRRGIEDF